MKTAKIIFWVTTLIIVIMEGVLPAFTSQTKLAKEGISHLLYPEYFGNMLVIFKILGSIALLIPSRHWIKEWAYAGFTFDFISAAVSHGVIDGTGNFQTYMPLIFLLILMISHHYYRKIYILR